MMKKIGMSSTLLLKLILLKLKAQFTIYNNLTNNMYKFGYLVIHSSLNFLIFQHNKLDTTKT